MSTNSLEEAQAFNCIAWIMSNGIVNERGTPIEFKDHAFMVDPYLDRSERQVIEKCSQIGYSVMAIIRSFHLAKYAKANIIHTFPSRSMSKDFVVPKVNPLIEKNPVVKAMLGVDTQNLKGIGDRFIYYRGSYEQTEAVSISADILMQDEYDRSDQKVLKTYRSRLDDAKRENPELGWEWQFSNPSIPGYGVDELFQRSDKKHWMVKCKRCNEWQFLTFEDNIDRKRKIRICSKCKRKIDKDVLRNGEWVKFNKKSKVSGYWISQLMVPWISAEKIIEDSRGDPEVFHNFTLGLPYVSKDVVVRRKDIVDCLKPGYNPRNNVAIGVDNGVTKHYVIGNRLGIFRVGKTKDWQEIENLRNFYKAHMVIDALPYPTMPRQLVEKYQGKVYIHFYRQDQKGIGVVKWDTEGYVAQSDRTKMIDSVVSDIHSQDILFNMTLADLDEYITHWENMYRVVEETSQGIMRPGWKTIEGRPDHYAHATVYWRIALEQTMSQGDILEEGNFSSGEEHPFVYENKTMNSLDLQDVLDRAESKGWKIKQQ
jgi:hypothetical protein